VYFNLVKTEINKSMFYPRKLTPAFIRMKKDPLRDLQIWERICYILLSIHVVLFVVSFMIFFLAGAETAAERLGPFNPNDSDFARPLCTHRMDDGGYYRFNMTRLQEEYGVYNLNSLFGFTVTSGECTLDSAGSCFRSPNYPSFYDDNQQCSINVAAAPVTLSVTTFSTEGDFDWLTVNGRQYSGTSGPDGVEVAIGSTISFTSDESERRPGFEICGAPSPAPIWPTRENGRAHV
jgi:hypothetical protein